MTREIWRSIAIGVAALAAIGAIQLGRTVWFCPHQRAWANARADQSSVVLASGISIARPGDAIFACATPHELGPFELHQDLKCYCAPQTFTAEAVSGFLRGSCVVDKPHPSPEDEFGRCRFARCSVHLDP